MLILLTGNYTFFNWLAIALCLLLFDDDALRRFFPRRRVTFALPQPSTVKRVIAVPLALVIVFVGGFRLINLLIPRISPQRSAAAAATSFTAV